MPLPLRIVWLLLLVGAFTTPTRAQRQMEALGRGVVAINPGAGQLYVSWRLLGTDAAGTAFNLYRASGSTGAPVRLNPAPLIQTTDFVDTSADPAQSLRYFVRPVFSGVEQPASSSFTLPANAPIQPYRSIPLSPPAGGTTPDGVTYSYTASDASAADLDGDGEYELVLKWEPTNAKDNSQPGYTGNVFLDGLRLDGTRLWRIDLGRNIRAGAHYTQFMVYDLDGDGRAELACKTADATTDGTGVIIGNAAADYRNATGYILSGPEYLTVFDGLTGAALATTGYVPARNSDPASSDVSAWGDGYGNRVDRFLAGIAYLDGTRPSLVMCRGYYTRTALVAWDWRDHQLTQRWHFDTRTEANPRAPAPEFVGWEEMGNHQLSVADVDADGRDEIVYGALLIDDTGRGLYSTGRGHGDALHVSDMDPDRPGLEVYGPHENATLYGAYPTEMRDALTGAPLWGGSGAGSDVGRGVSFDIDPRHRGYEAWGSAGGLYNVRGELISATRPSQTNFGIWWDADPLRELLDGITISKWDWTTSRATSLLSATGAASNNGTKATPALSADLYGDWREELVLRASDSRELRIYSTAIPAASRLTTLMHDPQYRLAIAWQNVAYNQPPHPGFYLGDGMGAAPTPNIRTVAAPPVFLVPPVSQSAAANSTIALTATATRDATLQWQRNGAALAGVTAPRLTLTSLQPGDAGLYSAVATADSGSTRSKPAIVGLTTTGKTTSLGDEVGPNIVHGNGKTYDQILLTGAAVSVNADPDQVLRISFIDLSDDIVQVEFSGAGTLTLSLASATGPAAPTRYNQSVAYMRGHPSIVITGANESTNLSVFSVGRMTAVNQALFRADVDYDGFADLAFVAIASANGKFGGLRTANASYFAGAGVTGVYAPGVEFLGPVYLGDVRASDTADPMIVLGSASNVQITGGDLEQANARPVAVSGFTALLFAAGTDSHRHELPAQVNRARLETNGIDVTAKLVTTP